MEQNAGLGGGHRPRRRRAARAVAVGRPPARPWRWSARPGPASRRPSRCVPRLYDVTGGAVRIDGHRRPRPHARLAPLVDRRRVAGSPPVPRVDRRQPALRRPRRDRRPTGRRGEGRSDPRHDRGACPTATTRSSANAGYRLSRRREAAPGDRPVAVEEPGDHDARRGDEPSRQRERGPDPGGARPCHGGPHRAGDRPPPVDDPQSPIASRSSRTDESPRSAPTTSCSPRAAATPTNWRRVNWSRPADRSAGRDRRSGRRTGQSSRNCSRIEPGHRSRRTRSRWCGVPAVTVYRLRLHWANA